MQLNPSLKCEAFDLVRSASALGGRLNSKCTHTLVRRTKLSTLLCCSSALHFNNPSFIRSNVLRTLAPALGL